MLLIILLFLCNNDSFSNEKSNDLKVNTIVYITPTGTRFHFSKRCAGENAILITVNEAKRKGYSGCKKCTLKLNLNK